MLETDYRNRVFVVNSDLGSNSHSHLENAMKRTSAQELVNVAASRTKPVKWIDKLSREDRLYIQEVIEAMKRTGVSTFNSVSSALKNELHLLVGITTIRDTLREMYNAKT